MIGVNSTGNPLEAATARADRFVLDAPQGVRGRNSDNTRLRQVLGWEPQTSLEEGLTQTYRWIHGQLVRSGRIKEEVLR